MKTFKREYKYYVIKIKDAEKLPYWAQDDICNILEMITEIRKNEGKGPLETVTVESRYPYYEDVWELIEKYATRKE